MQIRSRESALNQREIDMQKVKQKCNAKIQAKTTKIRRELDLNQRQLCEQLQVTILIFIQNLFVCFSLAF